MRDSDTHPNSSSESAPSASLPSTAPLQPKATLLPSKNFPTTAHLAPRYLLLVKYVELVPEALGGVNR